MLYPVCTLLVTESRIYAVLCLTELLRPYLPPGYRGLEVFARGLLPGWTSWGDQPLLLQRLGALLVTEQQAENLQRDQEQGRREEEQLRLRQVQEYRLLEGGEDQSERQLKDVGAVGWRATASGEQDNQHLQQTEGR